MTVVLVASALVLPLHVSGLLGDPATTAADEARKILAFETSLAQASRTRVELRDPA